MTADTLNSIKSELTKFWGSLSSDLQKKIGQNVAFTIALVGTTSMILAITKERAESEGIQSDELEKAIKLFEELDSSQKGTVNNQLSDYFLSRNK